MMVEDVVKQRKYVTWQGIVVMSAFRVSYKESAVVVLWKQQFLLGLDSFDFSEIPPGKIKVVSETFLCRNKSSGYHGLYFKFI